jgi:hypothetical protein
MHENNRHADPVRSRPSTRLLFAFVLVFAAALLAAACGSGDTGDAAASGGGDPSVTIATPADGAEVGTSFDVEMDLGFAIGEPDTGRQHIHLHYDDSSEYDIVYSDTHTAELEPGEHSIVAVVANADHSETEFRSAPVIVTVTDDPGPSGGSPTTSGDDMEDTPTTGGGLGY